MSLNFQDFIKYWKLRLSFSHLQKIWNTSYLAAKFYQTFAMMFILWRSLNFVSLSFQVDLYEAFFLFFFQKKKKKKKNLRWWKMAVNGMTFVIMLHYIQHSHCFTLLMNSHWKWNCRFLKNVIDVDVVI